MVKIVTHVLFPTDFSSSSAPAFRYAVEWAKVFDAQLTLLHVHALLPGPDIDAGVAQKYMDEQRKVAREELDTLLAEARQHVPRASVELVAGLPSECICQIALEKKCDLIMMGTHGWTGFNRVLFGSVAERVIQNSPCPILSIPHRETEAISGMHPLQVLPRQVILPMEFSDCSMEAYEYALQIAKWFDAPLTLVHAIEPLSYSLDFTLTHPLQEKTNRNKLEKRLTDFVAVLSEQGLSAGYELVDKATVDGILETSAVKQADLIVMGSHGRKGLSRMILGSTTCQVLEQSPYPVHTVKSPKFKGGHHPVPGTDKTTSSPA
jgi:nucleotide-binding universal stress UspA family protein